MSVSFLSIFHQRDGTSVFTCTDCGYEVHHYGPGSDFPVCQTCRFIGEHPHIPEEIRQLLRGEPVTPAVRPIPIKIEATDDGFRTARFRDVAGKSCLMRKTDVADGDCIWLGLNVGDVMLLSREHVAGLLPHLQKFVAEGEL